MRSLSLSKVKHHRIAAILAYLSPKQELGNKEYLVPMLLRGNTYLQFSKKYLFFSLNKLRIAYLYQFLLIIQVLYAFPRRSVGTRKERKL